MSKPDTNQPTSSPAGHTQQWIPSFIFNGDPEDGELATEYVSDLIIVKCGERTEQVTRFIRDMADLNDELVGALEGLSTAEQAYAKQQFPSGRVFDDLGFARQRARAILAKAKGGTT